MNPHQHHMTMDDATTAMNHANHSMATTMGMDHAGHNMATTMGMDHAGHNMATTMGMDHAGHNMATTMGMDHAGHNMATTMGMDHAGHNMGHGGSDMGHGMKMFFHDGHTEYVLFEPCLTQSVGAMVGACFAIFFLAILYEGLKFLREILLRHSLAAERRKTYSLSAVNGGSNQDHLGTEIVNPSISSRIFTSSHYLQTVLHMVQVFVSYCLMLVFMTYNVWLCLAIVLGAGVGYFVFGWKRAVVVDANEHCH